MLIVVGASGSGKDTAYKMLVNRGYKGVVTYTTRDIRTGETNGKEHHFITVEKFKEMMDSGKFAMIKEWYGAWYGTLKEDVSDDAVVLVDPASALNMAKKDPSTIIIYIKAPEYIRKKRMKLRGDKWKMIEKKLKDDRETFKKVYCNIEIENTLGINHLRKEIDKFVNLYGRV